MCVDGGQAYLEDFYDFCQTLGGTTAEVMSEALAVSAIMYSENFN
jgi:hypothetical protein